MIHLLVKQRDYLYKPLIIIKAQGEGTSVNCVICLAHTVKPRPEAHMDMVLSKVFLKSIDLIPQQQILQQHYLYYR